MAFRVVHAFEMIEIEPQQARLHVLRAAAFELCGEQVFPVTAVPQAGEAVGLAQAFEFARVRRVTQPSASG